MSEQSNRRIWTVSDYLPAAQLAARTIDAPTMKVLAEHHYHAEHCDGWEVAFWPCPTARTALERQVDRFGEIR